MLPVLLVAACGGGAEPSDEIRAYCGVRDAAAVEARITELLGQLTLEEKVALMHGAGLTPVDGVWLVEGNGRLGIPGLHMLDGPRGVSVVSGKSATSFPVAMMRGATWDPALEERVGRAIARELLSVGGDVLLAPTMNILRHPRWGRAQETYSEDVHHLGEMALAFVRGVQAEGVLASAKHYAANTIEDTRFTVDVHLGERTLREIYLPHFERVVREGHVASVMTAYNSVNGLHCDQQTHLVDEILKGEWGFAGFVESDWVFGTHGDVASVLAGLDVEMPLGINFAALPGAVTAGALEMARIDAAVSRILRAQLCFGLDERDRVSDDPTRRETPEHLALAREVARRGLVLLTNRGVLPFGPGVASIVVAGRNADVANIGDIGGSSGVRPTETVTALAGLSERAGAGVTVTHLPGTTLGTTEEALVRSADVVVVVTGLQTSDEGEGLVGAGDRKSLAVPPAEVAFIRALAAIHPAVVVVLEGGAAFVTSDWDGDVAALAHAFYPGGQGGRALADILFGDAAPTGRLPFSMPETEADLPPFDNTSGVVDYGYFHGYRHLAHDGVPAHYPFGFGLAYTTFARSDLTVEVADGTITARVSVRNTGPVPGTDTIELYVAASGSRVERAPYDLRAFAQVTLAAGETATVSLPVRVSDLAYYDEAQKAWLVEPLSYEVRVAGHAEDPGLVATVRVE
jgi:beta-glucosidase